MATWVQPASSSQSASCSRSSVIVPKLQISLRGLPSAPGVIRHAVTTFLWMSSPQQRSYTTSIASPPAEFRDDRVGCPTDRASALRAHWQQSVVPRDTRAQLLDGLAAPGLPGLLTLGALRASITGGQRGSSLSPVRGAPKAHDNCLEDMLSPVGLFPPFSQLISLGRLSLVLSGSQCPISLPWVFLLCGA